MARVAPPVVFVGLVHAAVLLNIPSLALFGLSAACLLKVLSNWLHRSSRRRLLASILIFALSLAAFFAALMGDQEAAGIMFLPPIIINAFFLYIFARTLLPNCEPLITRFRRLAGADLAPATLRYTRLLTTWWAIFFLIAVGLSIILPVYASAVTWSWVVNLGCPVTALLFFFFEHLLRPWLLPGYGPVSLGRTLRIIMRPDVWAFDADRSG